MEEEITLERLLTDFDGVIRQINEIVAKKDITAARNLLEQVAGLVSNEEHVQLDIPEADDYDHILHRLLDNISGVIEISELSSTDPDIRALLEERKKIDERIKEIDSELDGISQDGTTVVTRISEEEITALITELEEEIKKRNRVIKRENTREETRERYRAEITELEHSIRTLQETLNSVRNENRDEATVDTTDIDRRISEKEAEIAELERQLSELGNDNDGPSRGELTEEERARINSINEQIRRNNDLIRTLSEDMDKSDRDSEIWAVSFAERARLNAENDKLNKELAELQQKAEHEENATEEIEEVVLENIFVPEYIRTEKERDEYIISRLKEELEKKGEEYDPELYSIEYDGADGMDDGSVTTYRVVKITRREIAREEKQNPQRTELEKQLADRRKELEDLRKEKAQMLQNGQNTSKGSKTTIEFYEEQLRILQFRLEAERSKKKRSTSSKELIEDLETRIRILELRLESYRRSEETITTESGSKRREDLLKEKEGLLTRRKEIDDEIEKSKGKVTEITDRLDLGEKARIIGDKIFKTAQIREELAERGVTREEFLEFYTRAREKARANIEDLDKKYTEIKDALSEIIVDKESKGKNLHSQYREAKTDEEKIAVLEKIRKNVVASHKYDDILAKRGISGEITTKEQAEQFESFYTELIKEIDDQLAQLRTEADNQRENIQILSREIQIIKDEMKTIEVAGKDVESIERSVEDEKALRARQIRATVFGDPEMEQEWDKTVKRFISHRIVAKEPYSYIGSDGERHEITYQTMEDYVEDGSTYDSDARFLNLAEYRRYLENVSKYEASGGDPLALDLSGHDFDEYRRLEAETPGSGKELLDRIISEQKDYVRTFHGFTNEHAVRYANHRTAGSTLQGMLPVRGELPTTTKLKNAATNTLRFFGIRKPQFSMTNSKGEKVSTPVGGALTLATDAVVVGGIAAAAAVAPIALVPIGIGYAAKGIVTLGNVMAGRRDLKNHGTEIEQNLPTLAHPSARDKEVARREYYRDVEKYSRLRSWFRAKVDRVFTRNRAVETQEKIVRRSVEKSNAVIDERSARTIANARENLRQAEANQQVRQENTRSEIRGQDFYNRTVADPDSVDKDQALEDSAARAALHSHGKGYDSDEKRDSEKYQKPDEQLKKTQELGEIKTEGGTTSVAGITEAQKYRAGMETQDTKNRVYTMILTTAGNLGFAALRNRLTKEVVGPDKETTKQEAVYEDKEVYESRPVTEERTQYTLNSRTLAEQEKSMVGRDDVWNPNCRTTNLEGKNLDNVNGIVLRTRDSNGKVIEVSFSDNPCLKAGKHVQVMDKSVELTGMSVEDAIRTLREKNPTHFAEYLKEAGLSPDATDAEIGVHAIQNGEFFTQSGMNGWQEVLPTNLGAEIVEVPTGEMADVLVGTEKVLKGYRDVTETIPGDVTTVFSPEAAVKAAAVGAGAGAAVSAVDALHEAAHPTDKAMQGSFEDKNPDLYVSKLAKIAQDEYDRTHGKDSRRSTTEGHTAEEEEHHDDDDRDEH